MQPDFSRDARIAPILTRIAQLPKKPRLLITIDGPCGSGKSTLADALSAALLVCMAVMAARELARDKEGAITNHM